LNVSFWLALPVIVLASGFMIRTFIIFHDCGHQSFFSSRKANDFWGVITGLLTFTPYYYWHANHARHHATSANLDKRGEGDVWMMTVEEFFSAPSKEKWKYRLYRNPIIMFLLGPLFITLLTHRLIRRKASKKEKLSVYGTNLGILAIGVALSFIIGWKAYLIIQGSILYLSLILGIWLFYVQHQFEDVYWSRQGNWDFITASLEGGSFYKLPTVLKWFTGSIGYHHVHHVNPRIPNYNLAKCHDEVPELNSIRPVNLWGSLKALRFRLLDEETGKMVGFREAKKLQMVRIGRSQSEMTLN
jgi:omega-6 fatty acid desaturase (delta-12 desaturase)